MWKCPMKEDIRGTLMRMRQRKKEIGREKKQLDLEEEDIDSAITEIEEQFQPTVKEETDAEEEEEQEQELLQEEEEEPDGGQEEDGADEEDLEEDVIGVKEAEEDMDEDLEAGAPEMWMRWCGGDDDAWYAQMWMDQKGHPGGIPKKHTPCLYFFRAHNGCRDKKCMFSHEDIFLEEPFATFLQNLSWERKDRRTFTPRPQKKHRRGGEEA